MDAIAKHHPVWFSLLTASHDCVEVFPEDADELVRLQGMGLIGMISASDGNWAYLTPKGQRAKESILQEA